MTHLRFKIKQSASQTRVIQSFLKVDQNRSSLNGGWLKTIKRFGNDIMQYHYLIFKISFKTDLLFLKKFYY